MDGFKEKKWFVYLGDHHEGPFSLEDIQSKMSHGQLSLTNYVWAENMADWKVMSDVEEFGSILSTKPTSTTGSSPFQLAEPTISEVKAVPSASLDAASSQNSSVQIRLEAMPERTFADRTHSHNFDESKMRRKRKRSSFLKRFMFLVVILGLGFAYVGGYLTPLIALTNTPAVRARIQEANDQLDPLLIKLGDQVPFLGQWISPIPQLQDIDKEEYEAMKTAAKAKLDTDGPQIGIALSRADLLNPSFYVSSNLPDGARFGVYVEGISETLLNQLSFFGKSQAVVSKRLGETGSIRGIDGKSFPRGQYMVYFVDPGPDAQPAEVKPFMTRFASVTPAIAPVGIPRELKVVAVKSYFLGGARDATYTARLKEFHDKLSAKAQTELGECKQFAATLDMQLGSTVSKFASIHRGKRITPAQKSAWATFDKQWSMLLGQITRSFSKFTPETLKNDYFYGSLYLASQHASEAVSSLHGLQTGLFTGSVDAKSFEIQLGESLSVARSAVNELNTKIESIEKLPPKPNGMPNRDGM